MVEKIVKALVIARVSVTCKRGSQNKAIKKGIFGTLFIDSLCTIDAYFETFTRFVISPAIFIIYTFPDPANKDKIF